MSDGGTQITLRSLLGLAVAALIVAAPASAPTTSPCTWGASSIAVEISHGRATAVQPATTTGCVK